MNYPHISLLPRDLRHLLETLRDGDGYCWCTPEYAADRFGASAIERAKKDRLIDVIDGDIGDSVYLTKKGREVVGLPPQPSIVASIAKCLRNILQR